MKGSHYVISHLQSFNQFAGASFVIKQENPFLLNAWFVYKKTHELLQVASLTNTYFMGVSVYWNWSREHFLSKLRRLCDWLVMARTLSDAVNSQFDKMLRIFPYCCMNCSLASISKQLKYSCHHVLCNNLPQSRLNRRFIWWFWRRYFSLCSDLARELWYLCTYIVEIESDFHKLLEVLQDKRERTANVLATAGNLLINQLYVSFTFYWQ